MTASSSVERKRGLAPQGWLGTQLADERSWRLSVEPEAGEALVQASQASGGIKNSIAEQTATLTPVATLVGEIRSRLNSFPGFVVLTNMPVDGLSDGEHEAMLLALGACLGRPVSQDRSGTLVARVEDAGADVSVATQRGHRSSAALPFHVDRTDVIGLLCVRPATSGGESQLVSAYAVHDLLRDRAPDLLEELYRPLPHDRRGEELQGEAPWLPLSVFSDIGGGIVSRYVRRFIEGSQRLDDAPRLTARQREALDAIDGILAEPGVALELQLARGDLQLVDNYAVWHARSGFDDGSANEARLLLRLWLATADSPALPASFQPLYGSVAPGAVRGGVWPPSGFPSDLGEQVRPLLR